uniref:Fructose-bisphosphate aldolase n=1 Tax=Lygus hesperus TaxID=30085 RepID=A0A0A9WJ31_LYGHE
MPLGSNTSPITNTTTTTSKTCATGGKDKMGNTKTNRRIGSAGVTSGSDKRISCIAGSKGGHGEKEDTFPCTGSALGDKMLMTSTQSAGKVAKTTAVSASSTSVFTSSPLRSKLPSPSVMQ